MSENCCNQHTINTLTLDPPKSQVPTKRRRRRKKQRKNPEPKSRRSNSSFFEDWIDEILKGDDLKSEYRLLSHTPYKVATKNTKRHKRIHPFRAFLCFSWPSTSWTYQLNDPFNVCVSTFV